MRWFDDLIQFFPPEEFRRREHFAWLVANRPDIYRVDWTEEHLLLYMAYPELNFIDYLFVYPEYQGSGVGSKVFRSLQQTGKAILLEVEPEDPAVPDTGRRRRFYDRLGFETVQSLAFQLPSLLTGTYTKLDVLLWAPQPVAADKVYGWMLQYYQDLYAGIDPAIYGRAYPSVTECLRRVQPSSAKGGA